MTIGDVSPSLPITREKESESKSYTIDQNSNEIDKSDIDDKSNMISQVTDMLSSNQPG